VTSTTNIENRENTRDWTSLYEGNVRAQGYCGSCWAFATAGTVEGHLNIKKEHRYVQLSTQQLVSCNPRQHGCSGGHPSQAGYYSMKYGLVLESDYPYLSGRDGSSRYCDLNKYNYARRNYKISGYRYCETNAYYASQQCQQGEYEQALNNGPIWVGIEAGPYMQLYKSGIYEYYCNNGANHAVIAVQLTNEYIKIRNSWGINFGENGYIRIRRNINNNGSCYTQNALWYPTGFK
jgi:C1A family cysteine protease